MFPTSVTTLIDMGAIHSVVQDQLCGTHYLRICMNKFKAHLKSYISRLLLMSSFSIPLTLLYFLLAQVAYNVNYVVINS